MIQWHETSFYLYHHLIQTFIQVYMYMDGHMSHTISYEYMYVRLEIHQLTDNQNRIIVREHMTVVLHPIRIVNKVFKAA